MFIRELVSRFRNLRVSVTIDPQLLPELDCPDKTNTHRVIPINLYKLIYAIGTIQTRRFAPSNRMKFLDKSDLIEKIYSDSSDMCIKLDAIRGNGGQETLRTISEDFGVGLSVVIAEHLFNIEYSTIQRIYGHEKRPDWKCQISNNRILVVESKGSSSQTTSTTQETNALAQKARQTGDVKVASLTVLNETEICRTRFLDPPISTDNMDVDMKNKVLRAGHYSSIFSFLGHSILSKYYSQMRKRLLNSITADEQNEKENLYFELRDTYPNIVFNNNTYTGSFYKVEEGVFIFVGIDKRLLSYQGFTTFQDYEREIDDTILENHYVVFKDGIIIIEIKNMAPFSNIVRLDKIIDYQENITISDVDEMSYISFHKYIRYLLIKSGFDVLNGNLLHERHSDITARRNNKIYLFELKLKSKGTLSQRQIDTFSGLSQDPGIEKTILITNSVLPRITVHSENAIFIGREELRTILYDTRRLLSILNLSD